jgi:hypothetical protein
LPYSLACGSFSPNAGSFNVKPICCSAALSALSSCWFRVTQVGPQLLRLGNDRVVRHDNRYFQAQLDLDRMRRPRAKS